MVWDPWASLVGFSVWQHNLALALIVTAVYNNSGLPFICWKNRDGSILLQCFQCLSLTRSEVWGVWLKINKHLSSSICWVQTTQHEQSSEELVFFLGLRQNSKEGTSEGMSGFYLIYWPPISHQWHDGDFLKMCCQSSFFIFDGQHTHVHAYNRKLLERGIRPVQTQTDTSEKRCLVLDSWCFGHSHWSLCPGTEKSSVFQSCNPPGS